jgi:RHS repeat-associated protein
LRQSAVFLLSGDSQSTTTTYGYDYFGRLTSASSSGGSTNSYAYTYDVNGNRTSQTVNGSSTYYLYNAANELCWSGSTNPTGYSCTTQPSGGKSYTYDTNGNTLTGANNSFAYNNKNQTSAVTPNGGSGINMTYTGPGQARRTAAGSSSYVNDALGVASEGSTYYTRDSSGTVLGERNPSGGSGNYYFLFDGLGSVVGVCDATGVVKDTFKYSPFGESVAASAPIADPWRFQGGYFDSQTALYKMGERYYDQSLGRWTQLDSVNDPLDTHGWNRFIYTGDDPANFVDRTGIARTPCTATNGFLGNTTEEGSIVVGALAISCGFRTVNIVGKVCIQMRLVFVQTECTPINVWTNTGIFEFSPSVFCPTGVTAGFRATFSVTIRTFGSRFRMRSPRRRRFETRLC